jgi:Ca2+/Na+ antiporter
VANLSVGNILGANIANQTYVIGSAAGISAIEVGGRDVIVNFSAMIGVFALLAWIVRSDRHISRREGWGLLAFYFVYVMILFGSGRGVS